MKANVLAIDNDEIFLSGLKIFLANMTATLDLAESGLAGLDLLSKNPDKYDVVLLDFEMPGMKGDEVARKIKEINPNQKVIMLSGTADREAARICYELGADQFLSKGEDSSRLLSILKSVLTGIEFEETSECESDSAARNSETIEKALGMKGNSRAFAHIACAVERYAKSDDNVLIQGESGTGKEGIARAVHANSLRSNYPFIAVNCGAIPKDLLESELFGHERGAFTGALQTKKGKFQLANNGTLFLDEIGDLDLSLQVKILRALQERTIEPVGSQNTIKVNIRVIAATHRDLSSLVQNGGFREDLYYRLKVLPINIPPLRERPEDIEPLVRHFIAMKEIETGIKKGISDPAMRILKSLPWPGNVRQLEAAIKYAFINSKRVIQPESLEPDTVSDVKGKLNVLARKSGLTSHADLINSFLELERQNLMHALKLAGGVKSRAAELLGMSHQALNYRLEKLKVEGQEIQLGEEGKRNQNQMEVQ